MMNISADAASNRRSTDRAGEVISKAATAREESRLRVRFSDDDVPVEVSDDE